MGQKKRPPIKALRGASKLFLNFNGKIQPASIMIYSWTVIGTYPGSSLDTLFRLELLFFNIRM